MSQPTDRARVSRRGVLAVAGAGAAVTAGTFLPASSARAAQPKQRVKTGADVAHASNWSMLKGRKLGVITNPTGILTESLLSVVDVMAASKDVNLVAVFGPEHGFRGSAQAGESEGTYVDSRTGITVYDAYGAQSAKYAEMFDQAGVETVVFDIQDVGVRFYTYIWNMYQAMIAAVKTGREFIVLDRPNPIGSLVGGAMMQDGFTSGVGQDKILHSHGMTAGEIAAYFNGELMPAAAGGKLKKFSVVKLEGWVPESLFAQTGLPWVLPSPNVPTPDTALIYSGTCFFEATNMSEGRGTTRPFELIGAPYVDYRWAAELNKANLPGVKFREAYFNPLISKHEGVVCGGVQIHITNAEAVRPIELATHMMTAARDLYDDFSWRALDGSRPGRWIGLLSGSDRFKELFEAGKPAEEIIEAWRREERIWLRQREPYLLYKRQTRRR